MSSKRQRPEIALRVVLSSVLLGIVAAMIGGMCGHSEAALPFLIVAVLAGLVDIWGSADLD